MESPWNRMRVPSWKAGIGSTAYVGITNEMSAASRNLGRSHEDSIAVQFDRMLPLRHLHVFRKCRTILYGEGVETRNEAPNIFARGERSGCARRPAVRSDQPGRDRQRWPRDIRDGSIPER